MQSVTHFDLDVVESRPQLSDPDSSATRSKGRARGKVLVLGSDTRSFLTVIRSLGRTGKEVHVAWCSRDCVSKWSRYVSAVHSLQRPPSEGWVGELRRLLDQERFDLVIPCNDPSILPLHQHRNQFEDYPIYLVDKAIFDSVMDKASVNRIAERAGVKLPREVLVQSPEKIGELDALASPLVLKPTQSYVADRLSSKNEVVTVPDLATARVAIRKMLEVTPVAVQEYFDGFGVGVEFLALGGRVLSAFQHARLHEPPEGGGSSYRKSCQLDPELAEATARLVRELGYTGIGMAEFRLNPKTHDWIFVELNSRFWGSLPLAVNCGADFPAYLYEMLCEGRTRFPTEYKINRSCRNWIRDAQWLRAVISDNGTSMTKQLRLVGQLISELSYPLTMRETSDTLSWDDPSPGIREILEAAGSVPRRIKSKIARRLWKFAVWRERERRRNRRRMSGATRLLFVCKGNICRSPFAAKLASSVNSRWETRSVGYFPKQGRPSPENAVKAATALGVDLIAHRSQVLCDEAVSWADVIVIFDEENRVEIVTRYPAAMRKLLKLGAMLDEPTPDIADPYGGSVEDFHTTYSRIRRALDAINS